MKHSFKKEKGLTLVEVLAALVILSIVLVSLMSFFTQSARFTAHNSEKLSNVEVAEAVVAEIRMNPEAFATSASFTRDGYGVDLLIEDGPGDLEMATITVSSPEGAGIGNPDFTTQMYFEVDP